MWSGKCSAETLEQHRSAHFWQCYFLARTFLRGDRLEDQAKERQERLSFLGVSPYSQFFFLYCLYSSLSFLYPFRLFPYLFLFTILSHLSHSFLGAFAKVWKATISFVMSVCPPARPSAWNSSAVTGRIFMKFGVWGFSKICWENSNFIQIWQQYRVLCMKTSVH